MAQIPFSFFFLLSVCDVSGGSDTHHESGSSRFVSSVRGSMYSSIDRLWQLSRKPHYSASEWQNGTARCSPPTHPRQSTHTHTHTHTHTRHRRGRQLVALHRAHIAECKDGCKFKSDTELTTERLQRGAQSAVRRCRRRAD